MIQLLTKLTISLYLPAYVWHSTDGSPPAGVAESSRALALTASTHVPPPNTRAQEG